jgi:hypothetical protein
MQSTFEPKRPPTGDEIAEMADGGEDVSRFFTRKGKMMPPLLPIQQVNVDFTQTMLEELDRQERELNIGRQAVIKSLLRRALDQGYAIRTILS